MTDQTGPAPIGAYLHTREALSERYLITLSYADYMALCEQLREQNWWLRHHPAVLAKGQHNRLLIKWRIYGTPTKLIYCPRSGLVITALPYGSTYTESSERRFQRQQARKAKAYKRQKYRAGA